MLEFNSLARHHRRLIALVCLPLVLVPLLLLAAMASFFGASLVEPAAAQSAAAPQKPLNARQRRLLAARLSDRLMGLQREYRAGRKLVAADLDRWTDDNPNPDVGRIFDPDEPPRPIPDGTNIYEAAIKEYVRAEREIDGEMKVWNPWPKDEKPAYQKEYARCVQTKIDYLFKSKWDNIAEVIALLRDPPANIGDRIRTALAWNVESYLLSFPAIGSKVSVEEHPRSPCPQGPAAGAKTAVGSLPLSVGWTGECLQADRDKRTDKIKPYHPTTVALMYDDDRTGYASYCTGTLIAPNAVLTAAHCVCDTGAKDNNGQFYRTAGGCVDGGYVRRGSALSTLDPRFQTVFLQHAGHFEISRVVVHPQFRWTGELPMSDLAILFLKKPVPGIVPMKINTVSRLPPNRDAIAVGYGAHNPISAAGLITGTGTVLESGGLKLQANTKTASCNLLQRKRNHICWRYQPTDRFGMQLGSTCRGDSGGPVYAEFDGKTYLAGVVSGGGPSCLPTTKAFNIEVYAYRDWIQRHLMENPPPRGSEPPRASSSDGGDRLKQFACHFCALCDQLTATITTPPDIKGPARANITVNCSPDDVTRRSERVKLTVTSGGKKLCPEIDPIIGHKISTAVSCPLDVGPEQELQIKVESGLLQQCQIVATAFDASK